jgi:hypothetical protein
VRYFQGGGGAALGLQYRTDDGAWRDVPGSWLLHGPPPGPTPDGRPRAG